MNMYNNNHINQIYSGKVISLVEKSQFSSVAMFKAFLHKDLDLNKFIAIVTYSGLTNFPNMNSAIWNGKSGVDYFLYSNGDDALGKMNELSNG